MIRYDTFQTQIDAQNMGLHYEIAVQFAESIMRVWPFGANFLAYRTATLWCEYDQLLVSSCRPSVCNAMHCGFPGRCTGPKLYQRVPSMQVSICPFTRSDTFATQRTGKKQVEENANVMLFWDIENHACIGLACIISLLLKTWDDRGRERCSSVVTLWWTEFGCVHKI